MAQPTDYQATEYHRGEMKVDEHLSMYHLFNTLVHWGSLFLATVLSFLVLYLCAHAGLLPSAIVAVIVAAAGTFWLRRPKAH
jgi:cytochrome c oxidase subunit IV